MRTLKLQMQITLDGFVANPDGQLDWMSFAEPDEKGLAFINKLIDTSDTILMGRKMAPGFINYWESVPKESPEYTFAQKMVNTPKVIFSKTQKTIEGTAARMQNGDLKTEINKLKNAPGKDLLVYGGADFVSNLIKENLIDDYYLIVNPVAIGKGLGIFKEMKKLKLVNATVYGTEVLQHYQPIR